MKFYLDLLERSIWTFLQTAIATWLVTQKFDTRTFTIAGVAGLVAVLKCLAAAVPDLGSNRASTASTLPRSVQP